MLIQLAVVLLALLPRRGEGVVRDLCLLLEAPDEESYSRRVYMKRVGEAGETRVLAEVLKYLMDEKLGTLLVFIDEDLAGSEPNITLTSEYVIRGSQNFSRPVVTKMGSFNFTHHEQKLFDMAAIEKQQMRDILEGVRRDSEAVEGRIHIRAWSEHACEWLRKNTWGFYTWDFWVRRPCLREEQPVFGAEHKRVVLPRFVWGTGFVIADVLKYVIEEKLGIEVVDLLNENGYLSPWPGGKRALAALVKGEIDGSLEIWPDTRRKELQEDIFPANKPPKAVAVGAMGYQVRNGWFITENVLKKTQYISGIAFPADRCPDCTSYKAFRIADKAELFAPWGILEEEESYSYTKELIDNLGLLLNYTDLSVSYPDRKFLLWDQWLDAALTDPDEVRIFAYWEPSVVVSKYKGIRVSLPPYREQCSIAHTCDFPYEQPIKLAALDLHEKYPDVFRVLSRFHLSEEDINELTFDMSNPSKESDIPLTASEAACKWIKKDFQTRFKWESWIFDGRALAAGSGLCAHVHAVISVAVLALLLF